jgi:hypothetical protein
MSSRVKLSIIFKWDVSGSQIVVCGLSCYLNKTLTTVFMGQEACVIEKWALWVLPRTPCSNLWYRILCEQLRYGGTYIQRVWESWTGKLVSAICTRSQKVFGVWFTSHRTNLGSKWTEAHFAWATKNRLRSLMHWIFPSTSKNISISHLQ